MASSICCTRPSLVLKPSSSRGAVPVRATAAMARISRSQPAAGHPFWHSAPRTHSLGFQTALKQQQQQQQQPRGETCRVSASVKPVVNAAAAQSPTTLQKLCTGFVNLFPLWNIFGAALALKQPAVYSFMSTDYFTVALSVLMFSMGITMTLDDFKRVASKPGPVALNFIACYFMMPALALGIAKACGLSSALVAGCVLIGAINGGQASNLCTYIAKGDVALSVLMTTSTTIGTIFMTPLIAKVVLGTLVPVDAMGIVMSTIQVVLAPIFIGILANSVAPKACRAVEPFCPIIGVLATVILVGASVAKCAQPILDAGLALQFPLIALHLFGGLAGYFMCKMCKYDEIVARTTAIETSMKSSAFGFLLATLHFSDPMVKVPAAVSVVWMAIIGSALGVYWSFSPIKKAPEDLPPVNTSRPSA